MKKFRAILMRLGEDKDGVVLSEEALKGCVDQDVTVKGPDDNPIPDATAKTYWDDKLNALMADIDLPDGVDPLTANTEFLILHKLIADTKKTAEEVGTKIIQDHEDKVENIDRTALVDMVEIVYDCRNWFRYVKTREKDPKPSSDGGEGYRYNFGGMSCVEEGVAGFVTEEIYENMKRAAKAARAFVKVKNPLTRSSLQAENAFMLLMQQVYDVEPFAKGNRVLMPIKFIEEFEEISQ